jgi:hypothetical protein
MLPPASTASSLRASVPERWIHWLNAVLFFFGALFVILLPHSIKGARHAWMIAAFLWVVSLFVERKRPFEQPLTAPLLAFVVLSGISSALSFEPNLSWPQMKVVCIVLVAVLFAQSITKLSQVRLLVWLLLLSGLVAAGVTAWQYTYSIGVEVRWVAPTLPLSFAGIRPGDIITRLDGHSVHSPQQLIEAVKKSPPHAILRIDYIRGAPFHRRRTYASREAVLQSGLGAPYLPLARGKPVRAQGTLGHYMVFAEVLMQIGCLAWALLLSTPRSRIGVAALLAIIFLAVAAALFATQTRSDLAALVVGCFVALVLLARKHVRLMALSALVLLMAAATIWIQHSRKLGWIGSNDAGTQYRVLMWHDGARLVRQYPWFGVGMDSVFNHWQEWNIRAYAQYHLTYHFHSDFVQIAVERGLPALAAWLWFIVAYVVFLLRLLPKAREHSRFATGAVAGLLASFVGYLVPAVVQYALGDESMAMILFFYVGLAISIDHILQTPAAIDVQ